MSKERSKNPRALALAALIRIEQSGSYANLSLDATLRQHPLPDADRRLFTALVYGVVERKLTLDYLIDRVSSRKRDKIDAEIVTILRLGLYQLRYLDRVPSHAAVNESVALAPRRAAGFVNACLREYLRKKDSILFPDRESDPTGYLSVSYSIPTALCERFIAEFGEKRTESILRAFSHTPPLSIAVNPLHTTRDEYLARLRESGIEASPAENAPNGVRIPSAPPIESLPGFSEGCFYVQDEASQICVEALGALPGETVIDTCSCPGAKSFGSALRMKNAGRMLSFDLHENKLSLVRRGAERLGITILTAEKKDGKSYDPALEKVADRVLCDVPCSGFGVMGKKPDIRYKDVSETDRLPEIQLAILENCARYVRSGGTLVYSTCTIFSEENESNVRKFLASHPGFSPEDFTVGNLTSESGMLTLYPDTHSTDGFFVAKMRRSETI